MNSRECKHLRKTSPLFSAILIFSKDPISREMEWPWSVQAFKSSSGAPTEVSDLPRIWHLKNKALALTKRMEYLQYKIDLLKNNILSMKPGRLCINTLAMQQAKNIKKNFACNNV